MRIQSRIEQTFDLRQVDAAIFGIRVISMHQQRKKR